MTSNQRRNQHLMWRAAFGPAAEQLSQLDTLSPAELYAALKKASRKNPEYIDATDDYLKGLFRGIQDEVRLAQMSQQEKQNVQKKTADAIKGLNLQWLDEMVESDAQLREKLSFFWHGHFASRNINVFFQQALLDSIRRNALGSFRDLLHEVSKSAAMLNFLNANQNRKDHPNENFAREVMELFTLGRGHYTENDVKEAARAFTGWGATVKGEFVFRKYQHDDGTKTILGRSGNFNGDDVLDILLEQRQTATFIVTKVYRFFVNEDADAAHCNWLADRFYASGYDIGGLMDDLFTADWFYDEKNIGVRIKSPIELMAGIRRILPMKLENEETQLLVQRLLGQQLFYPPNVAGWPGDRSWIDSSTLMMRLRLPQMISDQDELNLRPKTDDDQMMGRMDKNAKASMAAGPDIRAEIDWKEYINYFEMFPREKLTEALSAILLQGNPGFSTETIRQYADSSSREKFIRTATVQIMSTPDYQLC